MKLRMPGLPRISTALVALSIFGLSSFGVGTAAPVNQTMNLGNQVSSLTIEPPVDVTATLSLHLLPPSCSARIDWDASPTSTVDAYEVRRLIASTGIVTGGPWIVPSNVFTYNDANVALALPVNASEWQVRALVGTWSSEWASAAVDNPVLCLLGDSAQSAAMPVGSLDDATVDDETSGETLSDGADDVRTAVDESTDPDASGGATTRDTDVSVNDTEVAHEPVVGDDADSALDPEPDLEPGSDPESGSTVDPVPEVDAGIDTEIDAGSDAPPGTDPDLTGTDPDPTGEDPPADVNAGGGEAVAGDEHGAADEPVEGSPNDPNASDQPDADAPTADAAVGDDGEQPSDD